MEELAAPAREGRASAWAAKRRAVTVLFTDLRNFHRALGANDRAASRGHDERVLRGHVRRAALWSRVILAIPLMGDLWRSPASEPRMPPPSPVALGRVRRLPEVNRRLATLRLPRCVWTSAWRRGDRQPRLRDQVQLHGHRRRREHSLSPGGTNEAVRRKFLVGSETRNQVGNAMIFREVDWVLVKGRQHPLSVYEPLGVAGELSPATLDTALTRRACAVTANRTGTRPRPDGGRWPAAAGRMARRRPCRHACKRCGNGHQDRSGMVFMWRIRNNREDLTFVIQ